MVASDIPCLRARSAVFTPASCSFNTAIICSSVNLARFICPSFFRSDDVAPAVLSRLNWSLAPEGGPDDEAEAVYGRADHRGFAGARAGCKDSGSVPQAWDQRGDLLQLEE